MAWGLQRRRRERRSQQFCASRHRQGPDNSHSLARSSWKQMQAMLHNLHCLRLALGRLCTSFSHPSRLVRNWILVEHENWRCMRLLSSLFRLWRRCDAWLCRIQIPLPLLRYLLRSDVFSLAVSYGPSCFVVWSSDPACKVVPYCQSR